MCSDKITKRIKKQTMTIVDKLLQAFGINTGVIDLPSRWGTHNYLVPTEEDENKYELVTEHDQVRTIGEDPIEACDPVDGPYMNLGYEVLPGKKVVKIEVEDKIYITLSNE